MGVNVLSWNGNVKESSDGSCLELAELKSGPPKCLKILKQIKPETDLSGSQATKILSNTINLEADVSV